MVQAGDLVLTFAKGGKRRFLANAMVRSAIERQFEVMGEAATRVSVAYRDAHPEVPWRTLVGFRNVLIHGYDGVDPERVWTAVSVHLRQALPELRKMKGQV
ncbi:MAG: DUF86 domain-containing protein [Thermoplasmatota archaeon]